MAVNATFYTVNGPRGEYYAMCSHATGKVWTERTEHAAREQARDEGLSLVEEASIDHVQLLDLMIPQPAVAGAASLQNLGSTLAGADEPTQPSMRVATGLSGFFHRLKRSDAPRHVSASPR